MNQKAAPQLIVRVLVFALLASIAMSLALASSAHAVRCNPSLRYIPNVPPRCEQFRYAKETTLLPYPAFLARKADFVAAGCKFPPGDGRRGACNKPSPYDAFNWTDDTDDGKASACSVPSQVPGGADWGAIFNSPCQVHDFGYRNFGHGLRLQRRESRRVWVDSVFRREMRRVCSGWSRGPAKVTCYVASQVFKDFVTAAHDGQLYGWDYGIG